MVFGTRTKPRVGAVDEQLSDLMYRHTLALLFIQQQIVDRAKSGDYGSIDLLLDVRNRLVPPHPR